MSENYENEKGLPIGKASVLTTSSESLKSPTPIEKEQEKRRGITPRLILKGQPYREFPDKSAVKRPF